MSLTFQETRIMISICDLTSEDFQSDYPVSNFYKYIKFATKVACVIKVYYSIFDTQNSIF